MKKILIKTLPNKKILICGTVKDVSSKTYASNQQDDQSVEVTYIVLNGITYDFELRAEVENEITLEFRDNDFSVVNYGTDFSKLNSRIKMCDVKPGDFIATICVPKMKNNAIVKDNFLVNDFKFKGVWKIAENKIEGKKEMNIIIGLATSPFDDPQGRFWRCSVPCTESNKNTKWFNLTFWNGEGGCFAEDAKKLLTPVSGPDGVPRRKNAIFICSEEKNKSYNNQVYNQVYCYSFELI